MKREFKSEPVDTGSGFDHGELMAVVNGEYKTVEEYSMDQMWPELTHLRSKWALIISKDRNQYIDICNKLFNAGYFVVTVLDYFKKEEIGYIDSDNKNDYLYMIEALLEKQKENPKQLLFYVDNPGGIISKEMKEVIDIVKKDFIIMYSQLPLNHPDYTLGYIIQEED